MVIGDIPPPNRALSQWFTSPKFAARVARWADVGRGDWVLEPSAGDGALAVAALRRGAYVVHAWEIDPARAIHVMGGEPGLAVFRGDFLEPLRKGPVRGTRAEPYDVALMNPPFEGGLMERFVIAALACSRRAVAILPAYVFYSATRRRGFWRDVRVHRVAFCASRPFEGARTDYVVLDLSSRATAPILDPEADPSDQGVSLEWWA